MVKKNIMIFLAGAVCGAIMLFIGLAIYCVIDPHKREMGSVKTFCNVEIQPLDIADNGPNTVKSLAFLLDSKPFMYMYGYPNGKIRDIMIVNSFTGSPKCILSMEPMAQPGQWGHLRYGNDDPSDRSDEAGLLYEDIDFNGYFDQKHIRDDKGNIKHVFIDLRGIWLEVNSVDAEKGIAQREDRSYMFVMGFGWQESNSKD